MRVLMIPVLALCMALGLAFAPEASGMDCLMCHKALSEGKVVHAAVMMGCATCHTGVDASQFPHVFKTTKKGLSSNPPDICFGCHDKGKFTGTTVHAPVSMGMCTSCHNPHKSEAPKLLSSAMPGVCYNCHGEKEFTKKTVHAPVMGGMCMECHTPHVNKNEKLLVKKGVFLCRKCHPTVGKTPHMITGFKAGGHPVRGNNDPARKGQPFDCVSCHQPHSSDWGKLFRYKGRGPFDLCTNCHTKY